VDSEAYRQLARVCPKAWLVIDQMEEIILVTGCHRTRSWANVAFLENQVDAQVSFGVKVEGPDN
jgi:hypothetical protein